jgi:hypothetical protein
MGDEILGSTYAPAEIRNCGSHLWLSSPELLQDFNGSGLSSIRGNSKCHKAARSRKNLA